MSNYTKSTNFATKDNLTPGDPLKVVRGTEIDTEFNNIATAVATKTDNSAAAITGGSITGITDLAVADGGTGASTAAGALNNLLPSQTSNANKYLQTDGTNASWDAVTLSTADITGTLAVANGGTGVTSSTGTGSVVLSNSPTLVTPALGTPASGTLTNATGLPISTGVSGLGTGVATFLGTPSSANLASAVSDETGSGALVFANSPTLVTPALGTPSALVGTNITGTASGLTAGNVTTNANLTGAVTSVGNASSLGSFTSSQLATALTDETGSGSAVFATSPTLVTPILGTPTSATLTNATGLPISTGVSGLGTGVATALAVNTGSAGAPVLFNGALGTPSSGTVTNLTGTASININGTVGATTASTGAFTTLTTSSTVTHNGGTANGVTYLNGSKVLTSGTALVFDGNNLGVAVASPDARITIPSPSYSSSAVGGMIRFKDAGTADSAIQSFYVGSEGTDLSFGSNAYVATSGAYTRFDATKASAYINLNRAGNIQFAVGTGAPSEGMRLTSTGLGIGTSSPAYKLDVSGVARVGGLRQSFETGLYTVDGTLSNYSATNAVYLNGNVAGGLRLNGDGTNASYLQVNGASASTSPNVIFFYTASSERVRITAAGDVGIGGAPSYKLDVAGEVRANNLFRTTDGTNIGLFGSSVFAGNVIGIGSSNSVPLVFGTGATERMRLDTSGNLGLGVTPSAWASGYNAIQFGSGSSRAGALFTNGINDLWQTSNAYFNGTNFIYYATGVATAYNQSNGSHNWRYAASGTAGNPITFTQAMTLTADGNLGLGTTSPSAAVRLEVTGGNVLVGNSVANNQLTVSRTGANASSFSVQAYTDAVTLSYTYTNQGLKFYDATAAAERARIDSSGNFFVNKTSVDDSVAGVTLQAAGTVRCSRADSLAVFNRLSTDGTLVEFLQAGTLEGSISVSGTTVSYNGGHLSRWAQTTSAKDNSIVKGTVLSNLDEMNVYIDVEGNPIDNEQLNKVKVSDVEGDANVAGVFVNWTHDDAHNVDEINMAMTGDMIIRIAQGVTVVRGDLLMSAGDGTAKPQGDDIIRSKTVAKVTSNHVTCTYADGSYCVPCVLMAC